MPFHSPPSSVGVGQLTQNRGLNTRKHQLEHLTSRTLTRAKCTNRATRLLFQKIQDALCWCCVFGSLFLVLIWDIQAASLSESTCQDHYQRKQSQKAAQCYLRLRKRLRKDEKRTAYRDLREDRYLRNAALCLLRHATTLPSPEQRASIKFRAAKLLEISFISGVCKATGRCQNNQLLAMRLLREIKPAPLSVFTGDPQAKIRVKGRYYKGVSKGKFLAKLLPGRYWVEVRFPLPSNKRIRQRVQLQPGIGAVINMRPLRTLIIEKKVQVSNKLSPWSIAGYIAGGVLISAGLGMAIYAPLEQNQLNLRFSDPAQARQITDASYQQSFDQATTLSAVGWVTLATGIVVTGIAVWSHVATPIVRKERIRPLPLPGLSRRMPTTPYVSHTLFAHAPR